MQMLYNLLYKIYVEKKLYKKALDMYEFSVLYYDSLLSEKNNHELIHQEYKYTYLKKSIADSIKNVEQQKVKDAIIAQERAENNAYRARQLMLFGGVALLVIFLIIVYNRYRVTKQQKKVIEEQKAMVEEASKTKLEYERLKQEHLKEDLTNAAQEITRRQQWLEQFKKKLYKVKSLNIRVEELNAVFLDIANQIQLDSRNEEFYRNIDQINQEFFQKLKDTFPGITPKEQELCGLIRLNLSTKEIATVNKKIV